MASDGPRQAPAADRLVALARELQAVGQTGMWYSRDAAPGPVLFDHQRYRQCVRIAADLLTLATGDAVDAAALVDHDHGHVTPKVDVRGVVVDGDAVLLVRERSDGCWTLPGGWADVNESPAESIEREVWEETGLRTRAAHVLAAWDRNRTNAPPHVFSVWKLFMECRVEGGELIERTDETDGCRYWPVDALPPLSEARTTAEQIRRCHAACRPGLPRVTMFD